MTREEAKDLLDNLIGMVSDNQESDYDTALKMGIKALEQKILDSIKQARFWHGCSCRKHIRNRNNLFRIKIE